MNRRHVLGMVTGLAAAAAGISSACTRRSADARLAQVDVPRDAPSGEVTAVVVEDGDVLRLVIQDLSGTELWRDDLPHVERWFPGVLWEQDADVLWILSTDHGNGSVRQDEAGAWVKTMGSDGMPEDIAALAR
ncbi:hypothetical protein [Brachybacterium sp. p3-SID957]|uniref:hypothetical protein n=1 Tax=Brachybacterium sp. p3-SID957 TaxID=2916049 RepID=UPI00223BE061|nr:hypothetical protein [Brachybacterium sp. p3-SID957]MCT1775627.1 hypothetical protein [Brachybacterium sp. p3-SID957]